MSKAPEAVSVEQLITKLIVDMAKNITLINSLKKNFMTSTE